jgi:hypothetical protein
MHIAKRGDLQVRPCRHVGTECIEVFADVHVCRFREGEFGGGVREDGTVDWDVRRIMSGVFTVG